MTELCLICNDAKKNVLFLPCGHLVACVLCANGLNTCPVQNCTKIIRSTVRVLHPTHEQVPDCVKQKPLLKERPFKRVMAGGLDDESEIIKCSPNGRYIIQTYTTTYEGAAGMIRFNYNELLKIQCDGISFQMLGRKHTGDVLLSHNHCDDFEIIKMPVNGVKDVDNAHAEAIACMAFSYDSQYLITCSEGGCIKLWGSKTMECIKESSFDINQTLKASYKLSTSRQSYCVAFHPSGESFMIRHGGIIKIWNLKAFKHVTTLHEDSIKAAVFSPDGTTLLSFSRETCDGDDDEKSLSSVKMWNYPSMGLVKVESLGFAHKSEILCVKYTPDGRFVISTCYHAFKIWDSETMRPVKTLQYFGVYDFDISHDGKYILSKLKRWNFEELIEMPGDTFIFNGGTQNILHMNGSELIREWEGPMLPFMQNVNCIHGRPQGENYWGDDVIQRAYYLGPNDIIMTHSTSSIQFWGYYEGCT